MTTWSGFTNHLAIGYDIWTDGYNTYTPSINVYIQISVKCDPSFNFNDSQTAVLSGSAGGSWTFQNTLQANQTIAVGTATIANQGQSYGGGPTYSFSAVLNGVYLGAGPSINFSYTLPPRPTRVPNAPGAPSYSSIKATSAVAAWSDSTDYGGINPDNYTIHVATNSAVSPYQWDLGGFSRTRTITGLAPNTTYWAQSFTHNADGWSAGSGITSFKTNSYQLAAPTFANIGPTSATINWGNPPTSDTPTQYRLQIATDSAMTNLVKDFTTTWAKTYNATGLTPNTTYYSRLVAGTATGFGTWSSVSSFKTLSGGKIMRGGVWIDAPVYIYRNGAWVAGAVYKYRNGTWNL